MNKIDTNSWRGVQIEILRRISEREWKPGTLVPNDAQLASEFGCARSTVHRAMRELATQGLLDRRRKAGTRVAAYPSSRIVFDIPIIREEVEQRNAIWRQSVLEEKFCQAPEAVRSRLGFSQKITMLHLKAIHYADNHPFLFEDRWINSDALPEVKAVDFGVVSANEWLVRNIPYTTGDIAFTAMSADKNLAEILDARLNAALFVVDRITWHNSVPLTSVRLTYAPGYRMNTSI